MAAKEELEVNQIEAVYRLTTNNKKLDAELLEVNIIRYPSDKYISIFVFNKSKVDMEPILIWYRYLSIKKQALNYSHINYSLRSIHLDLEGHME